MSSKQVSIDGIMSFASSKGQYHVSSPHSSEKPKGC
jgi:hypothetical protein